MPIIIAFVLLCLILVAVGKYIFPFIGDVIVGLYNALVDVIFNLLTTIYAIIPGHDFGIALIIFTALVRMLMWPLIKKQLHQTKVMRKIQPELKKIKEKAKGNKQLETQLMLELYREKGVNPFGSIGLLVVQLPVLFALYHVIRMIAQDKHNVVNQSFQWVRDLGYMKEVTADIGKFDEHLFGFIDLTQYALGSNGKIYIPILLMAVAAAVFQYFQSKQLMPQPKEKKTLRELFKEAGSGKQTDQSDVSAAMSGTMVKIFPLLTFVFALSVQGALTLYLLVTTLVGWAQQSYILSRDTEEMEELADKPEKKQSAKKPKVTEREKKAKEATVVAAPPVKKKAKSTKKKQSSKRKE